MASVNKVILIGNLGKDPEVRHSQDGKAIVNLSIATSETWREKSSGERKESVQWHRVVIFNEGLAKVAEKYLKKGSTVYLEGSLQTRKWTDKDGVEKFSTEVVLQNFNGTLTMLGGKPERSVDDMTPAEVDRAFKKEVGSLVGEMRREMRRDLGDEVPF